MRRTLLVCDLHDEPVEATVFAVVTVDGAQRSLDLCEAHGQWARDLPPARAGAPAAAAGRPARSASSGPREGSRRSLRAERAAARDWARRQGMRVGDKGRLPSGLLEDFRRQGTG